MSNNTSHQQLENGLANQKPSNSRVSFSSILNLLFFNIFQRGETAGGAKTAGGNGQMELSDFAKVLPVIVKF